MTKKKMTAGWLAQAIQDILKDQDMQARAREVGEQIQNERGIDMAIRYIHYLLM
jgi:UDP:flavonoid glycosyltransferase YjiC (YdhE family)